MSAPLPGSPATVLTADGRWGLRVTVRVVREDPDGLFVYFSEPSPYGRLLVDKGVRWICGHYNDDAPEVAAMKAAAALVSKR